MQAMKPYLSNWLAAPAFSPPKNQPMERTDIFLNELNLKTFFGASKNSKCIFSFGGLTPFTELSENYKLLQNCKYTWPATYPNKDLRVKNYKNKTIMSYEQ